MDDLIQWIKSTDERPTGHQVNNALNYAKVSYAKGRSRRGN